MTTGKFREWGWNNMQDTEFQEHINSFIDERLEESRCKVSDTKEYRKTLNKSYSLFDEIETVVNNATLTDDYKEVESELAFLQLKEAYKIGFKDSMKIFLYDEI